MTDKDKATLVRNVCTRILTLQLGWPAYVAFDHTQTLTLDDMRTIIASADTRTTAYHTNQ